MEDSAKYQELCGLLPERGNIQTFSGKLIKGN